MASDEQKVLDIIHSAIAQDEELREKHQIGDKFRFVRDRLQTLNAQLEEALKATNIEMEKTERLLAADEKAVFVYLFNAHGANLRTWHNMITPKVLYEYSVNRPIYAEKKSIESLIKTKTNRLQHGYLEMIVRLDEIIQSEPPLKDFAGNAIVKVKDGSLKMDNLLTFTHNDNHYVLTPEGELIKKQL